MAEKGRQMNAYPKSTFGLFIFGLCLHVCINLDRQAEQVDEAVCIRLIVDLILIERCDLRVIQAVRRGDTCINDVALIKLQLDIAGNGLLGGIYKCGASRSGVNHWP